MDKDVEAMCRKMTNDRIKRLIEGLHGVDTEYNSELKTQNQNKEKMASYSEALSGKNNNTEQNNDNDVTTNDTNDNHPNSTSASASNSSNFVKPIFLKDSDVHGSVKPERSMWITNVEIYKAVGEKVPAECIKGIQRIREMWRIYMDNEEDKLSLLVQADDGQIHRALTLQGCNIQAFSRERLRIDGKVTNCETGDRLVISKLLEKSIPRNLQIGKYLARIFHSGQPEFQGRPNLVSYEGVKKGHKCLKPGHVMYNCPNDWVCRICNISGHKMIDCPTELQTHNGNEQEVNDKHEETNTEQVNEKQQDDEHTEVNEDEPVTEKQSKTKEKHNTGKLGSKKSGKKTNDDNAGRS
ncbi:CNBP [Mytilus edulis]|uniref:CNBP n=1 Tax=Mytilus edulis TaxID=6550 RepID=A0A8S3Q0L4_MYTED|nr:CNBP [Mytilus edulis]